MSVAAGWYTDPNDPTQVRYFDGTAWTAQTQPNPAVTPPPAPPVAPEPPAGFVSEPPAAAWGATAATPPPPLAGYAAGPYAGYPTPGQPVPGYGGSVAVGRREPDGTTSVNAHAIANGWRPTVRPRHGQPNTRTGKAAFISSPPFWTYILLIFGIVIAIIVMLAIRKTVRASDWGYCDQCAKTRIIRRSIALGLAGASVVTFLLPSVGIDGSVALLGVFGLCAALLASMLAPSSLPALHRGTVDQDGISVFFKKPDTKFTNQVVNGS